jgi:integrase
MARGKGEGSWRTRKDGRLEYALPIGKTSNGNTKRQFFYGKSKREILEQVAVWRKKRTLAYGHELERTSLRVYLKDWLESNTQWAHTTRATNEDYTRIYILPTLGDYRLCDLTPLVLEGWLKQLRTRNLSPRVLELSYALLNQALRRATDLELLSRNPLAKVPRPHVPKVKRLVWTPQQTRAFRETIRGDRFEALWLIAMLVGYRRSELLGLRWMDVDPDRRVLHMRHTVTFARGKRIVREGAKTRSSLRSLNVPQEVIAALHRRRDSWNLERVAAGKRWQENDLVFPSAVGTPLPESTLRTWLDKLCVRADVPRLTPHGLRRTYASLLRLKDVDIKVVSERLGHSSVVTTQDIYQQTYAEQHAAAALDSDALLGGVEATPKPTASTSDTHTQTAVNLRSNRLQVGEKKQDALRKKSVLNGGAEDGT